MNSNGFGGLDLAFEFIGPFQTCANPIHKTPFKEIERFEEYRANKTVNGTIK